jgi:hypothetical protein
MKRMEERALARRAATQAAISAQANLGRAEVKAGRAGRSHNRCLMRGKKA